MTAATTPPHAVRVPLSSQRWSALTFLHWPVEAEVVRPLLPAGLHVQTYDGVAWIGLVPFLMEDVRVPPFPALPRWSTFPEVNLRTYVRHGDGSEGVWFLRLWSTRRTVNLALRQAGLPYRRARTSIEPAGPDTLAYSADPACGATPLRLRAVVRAEEAIVVPTPLENWLTARWNAYATRAGHVWRVPIDHGPWPLRRATVTSLETDVFEVLGLPEPADEPLAHASRGVRAAIGVPRPTGSSH